MSRSRPGVRYQPDDQPPLPVTVGLGVQYVKFTTSKGWTEEMENRLRAVGEETMQVLTRVAGNGTGAAERRLLVIARADREAADLEFIATTDATNIGDQLAMLTASAEVPDEAETPLRLLRHHASSIRHQQYRDIDILTTRVEDAAGRESRSPLHGSLADRGVRISRE